MNTISLDRIKYLFTEYFTLNWKRDTIIFGIFFLLNIVFGYYFHEPVNMSVIIVIVMVIFLSRLLKFVENTHQRTSYLLTPANIKEKFITNVLISHLYFALLLIVPIILGYNTGLLLDASFHDLTIDVFHGASYFFLKLFGIHSVFMFGILLFKRRGALKTLLCLVGLFIICIIIIVRLLFVLDLIQDDNGDALAYFIRSLVREYAYIFHTINYIVIFTFWILGYFRLKRMRG